MQAMGQLCAAGQLPVTALQQVASCLLDILGAHTEGSQRPEESTPGSRLYFAVLRTLQTVLLQVLRPGKPSDLLHASDGASVPSTVLLLHAHR